MNAVNWISEQLAWRIGGILRWGGGINRRVAVGSPHAVLCSGLGIEHADPPVQVAVGDVNLMSLLVHFDSCGAPENGCICIVHWRRGWVANLDQQFSVVREFDCLAVFGAIPGNPNVAGLVHKNTMLGPRPVVA